MRFEQYEIWVLRGQRWEMSSSFAEFDLASAVANTYKYRMRLIHAVYEGATRAHQDVLLEMGATREEP